MNYTKLFYLSYSAQGSDLTDYGNQSRCSLSKHYYLSISSRKNQSDLTLKLPLVIFQNEIPSHHAVLHNQAYSKDQTCYACILQHQVD